MLITEIENSYFISGKRLTQQIEQDCLRERGTCVTKISVSCGVQSALKR